MEVEKVDNVEPQEQGNAATEEVDRTQAEKDSVQYDTYKRVLSKLKQRESQLDELSSQLNEFKTQQKQREEEELRKKEDWKTLLEKTQAELEQERQSRATLQQRQVISEKARAFINEVGGLKHDRYLELVDFDAIGYDDESGKVDDLSLKKVVDQFKAEHDALLAIKPSANVPNSAPKGPVKTQSDRSALLEKIASSGLF